MTDASGPGVVSHSGLRDLETAGAIGAASLPLRLGQNTVKLHIGRVAWLAQDTGLDRAVEVGSEAPIRLMPGELATFVTNEWVDLPLNVTGCMFPRGRVLTIGLSIPTTYVDPGFAGHLRIIVTNAGRHTVDLPLGFELARLELTRLAQSAPRSYHGVNAELHSVNPRADDLIVETLPAGTSTAALEERMRRVEERIANCHQRAVARRRRAAAAIVCLTSALAVCASIALTLTLDDGPLAKVATAVSIAVILATGGTLAAVSKGWGRKRLDLWIHRPIDPSSRDDSSPTT